MVQLLGVCLPVQGMWVRSLAGELGFHMLRGNWSRVLQLVSLHALESAYHKLERSLCTATKSPLATTKDPMCHKDTTQPNKLKKKKITLQFDYFFIL